MQLPFRRYGPEVVTVGGIVLGIWASFLAPSEPSFRRNLSAVEPAQVNRTTDCGAVALYVICKKEGINPDLGFIRELVKTTSTGTNMLDLARGAESVGFNVKGCRCSFEYLYQHIRERGHYAILHSKREHFVAVISTKKADTVRVVDLPNGVKDMSMEDLQDWLGWEGNALLLSRG